MKDQVTSIERPLRLVDGKFMRGDIEVKPEIGNPEQIALLQKIERERTQRKRMSMMAGWIRHSCGRY
jgi:hypothetical protein